MGYPVKGVIGLNHKFSTVIYLFYDTLDEACRIVERRVVRVLADALRRLAQHVGDPLRVALAALSGYSDWPMRVVARRLGAGFTVAEVLLDQFVLNVTKGRKAKRFIRVSDEERPTAAWAARHDG